MPAAQPKLAVCRMPIGFRLRVHNWFDDNNIAFVLIYRQICRPIHRSDLRPTQLPVADRARRLAPLPRKLYVYNSLDREPIAHLV
jgi:hypothetical protein